MSETLPEDEVNEITRATANRVDAVHGPAHGRPFLMLKSQTPNPADVRVRLYKGKYDEAAKKRMGAQGHAFRNEDGSYSYPIGNTSDLHDAILAVGRGGASHDAIRRYIKRRAKELGATGAIPDSWSGEGEIKKAMADVDEAAEALEDLKDMDEIKDADVVPDAGGVVAPTHPGDPSDPGSAAWEATDAAEARAALAHLNSLKRIICDLRDRESQEAATSGGASDVEHVMDLGEAESAVDYALGVLAKFAVTEQAEADTAASEVEEQAEALGIKKSQIPPTPEVPVTAPTVEPVDLPPAQDPVPLVKAGLSADDMRGMIKKLLAGMSDEQVAAAFGEMAQHASAAPAGGVDDSAPADEGGAADGAAAAPPPEPVEKAAPGTETDVPEPVAANRSTVPGPDTTPVGVGDSNVPIVKADADGDVTALQKALDTYGSTLMAGFEERMRAVVGEMVDPMQQTIKKMQERVLPGGPLLNGVNVVPGEPGSAAATTVPRGQDAQFPSTVTLRKQLEGITDPDQRAAAQGEAAFTIMKALQQQVGPAPRFGPRSPAPQTQEG